jgi:hypothetical protein
LKGQAKKKLLDIRRRKGNSSGATKSAESERASERQRFPALRINKKKGGKGRKQTENLKTTSRFFKEHITFSAKKSINQLTTTKKKEEKHYYI